jgi:hypothetical protein
VAGEINFISSQNAATNREKENFLTGVDGKKVVKFFG